MKPLTDKINYFLAFSETEIDETVLKSSDVCKIPSYGITPDVSFGR